VLWGYGCWAGGVKEVGGVESDGWEGGFRGHYGV